MLLSYILLLALLHAWGFFRIAPVASWNQFLWRSGIKVEGIVVSGSSDKRLGERIQMRVSRIEDQTAPSPAEIFAYLPKRRPENENLRPGRRIALWGRLRPPRWPRNPGEFDERGFCSDRGVAFLLQAKRLEILDGSIPWRWLPWAWAEAAHRSIHRMLTQALPLSAASVWEGILLGYKGSLPGSINRDIQDAGVMHLLVPSGAKMAFVLALCLWTSSRLGLGPWMRALVAAVAGGFYALVVGAEPPYLRAYGCALVGFMAKQLERDPLGFQAVILSAFGILLLNPRELFSAGFQMTYAAILGVMIAMPRWKVPGRWSWPIQTVVRLSMISFVVQLMLWPILAWIFGRVSVIGLAANAVLVPASGVYMAVGFAAWLLYGISSSLFQGVVPCLGFMARIFQQVCSIFAACPGAAWSVGPVAWPWTVAFYLAAIGLLAIPRWSFCWKSWAAAGLVAAVMLIARKRPEVQILFLDQSNRGAVLARLPDGRDWLLASTLSPSGLRQSLSGLGISRLSGMLISAGPEAGQQARAARRLAINEVDVLRPDFHREWGPVNLAVDFAGPRRKAPRLRISFGQVRLLIGRRKAVVSDGRSQFCILHFPFASFGNFFGGAPGSRAYAVIQGSQPQPQVWRLGPRERSTTSAQSSRSEGSCGFQRTVSTRRNGAVWVRFDDSNYSIDSQKERYSVDRPFL